MNNFGNTFDLISNKNLRKELELCDETIDKLTKKCEILEENNKLLIQQKYQMYEDLDIAYKRIDKAIECIKNRNTTKSKKERFMSGETTLEEVFEILEVDGSKWYDYE